MRLGVALDEDHVLDVAAHLVGGDLGEHRLVALPLAGQARGDVDLSGDRMDLDVPALIGAESGPLDIEADPEAEIAPLRTGRRLLLAEIREADGFGNQVERLLILARIVVDREPVGEEQPIALVGKFARPDEVAPADLGPVDAELVGELVQRALDREAGLRPPAAAVWGDLDAGRIDERHLDPDIGDAVRPGDRGRGDLGDGDSVGDKGAGIVDERVAKPEDRAVLLRGQRDLVDLGALLAGADEVLHPVLDIFHRPVELHGGKGHEYLVRVEHHDFLAEPATHVRRDDADPVLVDVEQRGESAAHRDGRLRGIPNRELARHPVPAGGDRAALHRRRRRAFEPDPHRGGMLGPGESGIGVAALLNEVRGDIVGDIVMDRRRPVGDGLFQIQLDRKRLVVDFDKRARVFRGIPVDGDDHRDALAGIEHVVAGQRALRLAARRDAGMRDQHRQFDIERADIVGRVDRHDIRHRLGR